MAQLQFTRYELEQLDTIEQAWDGDELKIQEGNYRVWLVSRENRPYNGYYVVETKVNGRWETRKLLLLKPNIHSNFGGERIHHAHL